MDVQVKNRDWLCTWEHGGAHNVNSYPSKVIPTGTIREWKEDVGSASDPVRLRMRERDGGTFPLPMQQMDSIPKRDATVYRHPQKQLVLLFGRKLALRRQVLVSQHGGRPSNDTICHGHKPTGCIPINQKGYTLGLSTNLFCHC